MARADGNITISTDLETQDVESSMNKFNSKLKYMIAGAIIAWTAFKVAVARTGDAFDQAMAPIAARTGMTQESLTELEFGFRDLSRVGANSAIELATAFQKIAIDGRTAEESFALMNYAQTLAIATNADLTQATQFLGLALMKTNQDVDAANKYIDVFSGVVAQSGMSLGNLQKAIITLAPTMNASGTSVEYMSGTLAQLYRGGIYGVQAGRGLEQVFNQLTGPSDRAATAMRTLGINTFDTATGALRPFNDILLDAMKALDGVATEQERVNLTQDLFSTVYARAVFDELSNNKDAWQDNIRLMYEAGDAFDGVGRAFGMAEIQSRNLTNVLGSIRNALSDILITVWQTKREIQLDFLEVISNKLWDIAEMLRPGGSLHGGLLAVQGLFSTVITVMFTGLSTVIGLLVEMGTSFPIAILHLFIEAVQALASGLYKILGGAISFVGYTLKSLISQFSLLVLGMSEIQINITPLLGLFESIANLFMALVYTSYSLILAFSSLVLAIFPVVGELNLFVIAGSALNSLFTILTMGVDYVTNKLLLLAAVLRGTINGTAENSIELFGGLGNVVTTVSSDFIVLFGVFSSIGAAVRPLIETIIPALISGFAWLLNNIRVLYPIIIILAGYFIKLKVIATLLPMIKALTGAFKAGNAVFKAFSKEVSALGSILYSLLNVVGILGNILKTVFVAAVTAVVGVLTVLTTNFDRLFTALKNALNTVLNDLPYLLVAFGAVAALVGGVLYVAFRAFLEVLIFLLNNIRLLYPILAILAYNFMKLKVIIKLTQAIKAYNLAASAMKANKIALNRQFGIFIKQSVTPLKTKLKALVAKMVIYANVLKGGILSVTSALTAKFVAMKSAIVTKGGVLAVLKIGVTALTTKFISLGLALKGLNLAKIKAGFVSLSSSIASGTFAVNAYAKVKTLLAKTVFPTLKKAALALFKVLMANPITAIVAGVTALTVGIAYLIIRMRQQSYEVVYMSEVVSAASKAQQELVDTVESSAEAFIKQMNALQENRYRMYELKESIIELADSQDRALWQTVQMERHIDELNGLIPGLNLAFDATEDSLNRSSEAMLQFITASQETAYLKTLTAESNRLAEEGLEIAIRKQEATRVLNELNDLSADGTVRRNAEERYLNNLIIEAIATLATYTEMLEANSNANDLLNVSIQEQMQIVGEAQQAQEELIETLARQQAAIEAVETVLEQYANAVSNVFQSAASDSESSAQSIIDDLRATSAELETTAENWIAFGYYMDLIDQLAKDLELSAEVVEHLRSMGIEGLPHIREFVADGGNMLQEMDDLFTEISANTVKAVATEFAALGNTMDEAMDMAAEAIANNMAMENSMVEAVVQTFNAAHDAVQYNDPSKIGLSIGDGTVEGIEATYSDLRDASSQAIDEIFDTMTSRGEMNSPSRRTRRYGTYLSQGLVHGLLDRLSDIRQATHDIIDEIYKIVRQLDIKHLGQQIMQGLESGLWSQHGSLMSAAQSIADGIRNTIQSALQIRSPSRVAIYLGRMFSEGIAVGLLNGTKAIESSLKDLCSSLTTFDYPDFSTMYEDISEVSKQLSKLKNTQIITKGIVSYPSTSVKVVVVEKDITINIDGEGGTPLEDKESIRSQARKLGKYLRQETRSKGVVLVNG